jgi:hypothetical protein
MSGAVVATADRGAPTKTGDELHDRLARAICDCEALDACCQLEGAMAERRIRIESALRSGLFLGLSGPVKDHTVFGYTCVQVEYADSGTIWLMRDEASRGPTKGPMDAACYHLVHEMTKGGLCWGAFGKPLIIANYYFSLTNRDDTGDPAFNCRTEEIGGGLVAINNHDRSHVLTVEELRRAPGTPVVSSTWKGGTNQRWRLIEVR